MDDLCLVYITSSGREEALRIGHEIVSGGLAACANVYDGVTSVYRWEGKINVDQEAVLLLKTRRSLFEKIEQKVKELHSYDCPCIVAVPFADADEKYAEWIRAETK